METWGVLEDDMLDAVRVVTREQVEPLAIAVDEDAFFPETTFHAFRELGLFAMAIPERFGGLGSTVRLQCRVVEAIATACANSAEMILTNSTEMHALQQFGTERQKEELFGRVLNDGLFLAFAMTEPEAGSDPKSISTTATATADGYVLSGVKAFASHGGGFAGELLVIARVAGVDRGLTAFFVPGDAPGLGYGERYDTMGLRGTVITDLHLDGVRVGSDRVLGQVGEGLRVALSAVNYARPIGSAIAQGTAQGALDAAVKYARERRQFDRPIASFQGVKLMLADMAIELEAARALLYRAADLFDAGDPDFSRVAPMAKVAVTDAAMRVTLDAVQVLGGVGYLRDVGVERRIRDAKAMQIWEGTNQIQRLIIARQLIGAAHSIPGAVT